MYCRFCMCVCDQGPKNKCPSIYGQRHLQGTAPAIHAILEKQQWCWWSASPCLNFLGVACIICITSISSWLKAHSCLKVRSQPLSTGSKLVVATLRNLADNLTSSVWCEDIFRQRCHHRLSCSGLKKQDRFGPVHVCFMFCFHEQHYMAMTAVDVKTLVP